MRKSLKIPAVLVCALLIVMSLASVGLAETSTKGLVAHFTFDGNYKDAAGSGMEGSPVGDVTITDDGVIGQCATFNRGYLDIKNSSSFNVGEQYTVAAWVKMDGSVLDSGQNVAVVCKLGDVDNNEGLIWEVSGIPQDMGLLQKYYNSTQSVDTQSAGDIDCQQKWTHLVFENDGTTLYAYVDGKLAATYPMNRPSDEEGALLTSKGNLLIGNDNAGEIYSGKIDDLRIYNYVLTGSEVSALASTGSYSHKIVLQLCESTMYVDGKGMPIDASDDSICPFTENGRTLVPVRAIVENMGGKITWDAATEQVVVTLGAKTIKLRIKNLNAEVNGKAVTLDVPPQTYQGRTMLPLRFVAENLGAKVDWDGSTQKITLSY